MARPPVQHADTFAARLRRRRGLVLHLGERDVRAIPATLDGRLCTVVGEPWKHGPRIEVTIEGRRVPATVTSVENPGAVAKAFLERIEETDVRQAERELGLRVNVSRNPTLHELRDAIVRSGLSIVYLDLER